MEYLSPQKVDPVNPRKNTFAVGPHRPLPWEPDSEISRTRSQSNVVWQHTVYAGIFAVDKVRDVLVRAFRAPESERDFDGRIGGDSAVLCFTVNQDGLLIKDSLTLSSCAWAIGQTLDPGPQSDHWLAGFDEDSTYLLQRLLDLGDGNIEVDRQPVAGPASPQSGLGTVAGLMSRLVVSAAKGGLGVAAGAVEVGLGPVVGGVAAKVIEEVGGDAVDSAAARVIDHPSGSGHALGREEAEQGEAESEAPPPEVGTKVLDVYDLAAITRWVAEQLGVAEALLPSAIRIKSHQVPARRADEASGDVFLNSFYADDLEGAADLVEAGKGGTALLDYLRADADLDAMNRFDVRNLPEIVLENVQPSSMPLGRWLADGDKPLVLSQQFAVNRILASLGQDDGRGLYAVNGPPGTGKTTMLRDLIAALVVQRAERLAVLKRPEDAFTRKPRTWRTEEHAGKTYPRTIYPPIPELTGFEIVIASSNNGAVENVALEVPGARSIGDAWRGRADYLAAPASLALEEDAWGAIAARLGRRGNRSDFVQRFWWGESPKNNSTPRPEALENGPLLGLHKILQLQHLSATSQNASGASPDSDATPPLGPETWKQAVQRFTQARRHVRALAAERQEIADLLTRLTGPDALMDELVTRESSARDTLLRLQREQRRAEAELARQQAEHTRRHDAMSAKRGQLDLAEASVRYCEEGVRAAESALYAYDAGKPGLVKRMFTREPMRNWEAGRLPLQATMRAADARLAESESARAAHHAALRSAQGELDQALVAIMRTKARVNTCEQARERQATTTVEAGQQVAGRRREREAEQRRLAEVKERWGNRVPGAEWQAAPGRPARNMTCASPPATPPTAPPRARDSVPHHRGSRASTQLATCRT